MQGDQKKDCIQLNLEYVYPTTAQTSLQRFVISVGRNLAIALRYLRDSRKERHLWVDALCINQGDDVEKSKQVQSMSSIYSKAERVISWLGEGTPEIDHAMDIIGGVGISVRSLYLNYSQTKFRDWRIACCLGWAWGPSLLEWRNRQLSNNEYKGQHLETQMKITAPPGVRTSDIAEIKAQCVDFLGVGMLMRLYIHFLHMMTMLVMQRDELLCAGLEAIWGKEYWSRIWVRDAQRTELCSS